MNQAQQPQVMTLDEIDPDTRKKATAAYNAGHGHAPDYGFAPDRAWIEGWAYAQSTKDAPAAQPAAPQAVQAINGQSLCQVREAFFKKYGREPLADDVSFAKMVVAAFAATQPAAQGMDAIRALIAQHSKELEHNHYAYFELAYTRRTGWMVWITDKPAFRESVLVNPDRKVLASGQGDTPEAACAAALAAQAKQ